MAGMIEVSAPLTSAAALRCLFRSSARAVAACSRRLAIGGEQRGNNQDKNDSD
jgi:hypothetical protein